MTNESWLRDLARIDADDCFFCAMGRLHAGEVGA